ncbi:hypothetical protein ACA910_009506 [Epithemia clementina (nom. ined.)]
MTSSFSSSSTSSVERLTNNGTSGEEQAKQPQQEQKRGYRFGDLTRSFLSKRVAPLIGKDEYEFGDLSRKVGSLLTDKLANVTAELRQSDNVTYEFGALTKAWIANYTGKDRYEFGDLSQAVLRRVQSGDYSLSDLFLAMRLLFWAGFRTFGPVAANLPMAVLINLINFGLAQEVSDRVTTALAEWLDQRMKQALLGRGNYVLGDITKERLQEGIAKFTGKEQYEFGDIARTIQGMHSSKDMILIGKNSGGSGGGKNNIFLPTDIMKEMDKVKDRSEHKS